MIACQPASLTSISWSTCSCRLIVRRGERGLIAVVDLPRVDAHAEITEERRHTDYSTSALKYRVRGVFIEFSFAWSTARRAGR